MDEYPMCADCDYWSPNGAKPLLHPSFGDCEKGVTDTANTGKDRRTSRHFGCTKHSDLESTDE